MEIGPGLAASIGPGSKAAVDYIDVNPNIPYFSFREITVNDVIVAINALKSKKSSGVDGVTAKLIKHIKLDIAHYLTIIINQSIRSGIFPKKLKIAKIIHYLKKAITLNLQTTDRYQFYQLFRKSSREFFIIKFTVFSIIMIFFMKINLGIVKIIQMNMLF